MEKFNLLENARKIIAKSDKDVGEKSAHNWVALFCNNNKFSNYVNGKGANAHTLHENISIEFKNYINVRIEKFLPRTNALIASKPMKIEQSKPSKPVALTSSMEQLTKTIADLRQLGYTVECSVQAPAREL